MTEYIGMIMGIAVGYLFGRILVELIMKVFSPFKFQKGLEITGMTNEGTPWEDKE